MTVTSTEKDFRKVFTKVDGSLTLAVIGRIVPNPSDADRGAADAALAFVTSWLSFIRPG